MPFYQFTFATIRFLFVYLNYLIKHKFTTSLILFFSVIFTLLVNISLQRITLLLAVFAIPFVLYSTIARFLSSRYPPFVIWEKEHMRITFSQMGEFWGLLTTGLILALAKTLLLDYCNIQQLLDVVTQLESRINAIYLTADKALESLEKKDFEALSNYLVAMKSISHYCHTCIDPTTCNLLKEFFERNSLIGVAHAAGGKEVIPTPIPETSQKTACTQLIALYTQCVQANNSDLAKQVGVLVDNMCKEEPQKKEPWINITGPIFSTTTEKR